MNKFKTLIESYQPTTYQRVQRSEQTHQESARLTEQEISRLLKQYPQVNSLQQRRLIRDAIDHWLRRYHGYVIGGGIRSHYRQKDVDENDCIFEHIIPARDALDMLLQNIITIRQAMEIPTCLISKHNDRVLRESGRGKSSPDYWFFFARYDVLDAKFCTHSGQDIDIKTWTLENHYNYFNS